MSTFPQMDIRQPLANDLVDDPIQISGLGTAFEAEFRIRVRDAQGTILGERQVPTPLIWIGSSTRSLGSGCRMSICGNVLILGWPFVVSVLTCL